MLGIPRVLREYEPLAKHTSWRIGGAARFYAAVENVESLQEVLHWGYAQSLPLWILGSGTNVLVRDEGFDGLVIRYMARTWEIAEAQDGGVLYAEAGVPIGRMVWMVGARGWGNMEWAAGLPGSAGGALYGNAGCYGGDVASILRRAWVLVEDEVQEWSASHMGFAYRSSVLKAQDSPYTSMLVAGSESVAAAAHSPSRPQRETIDDGPESVDTHRSHAAGIGDSEKDDTTRKHFPVIPRLAVLLAGEFQLARAEQAALVERMQQVVSLRKAKTPVGSSCGSVFKNPSSLPQSAGQLIDAAGLKGTRIGAAEISQMHANYIVNLGGASADDVLRLIEMARSRVLREFGVELELEIQVSGG